MRFFQTNSFFRFVHLSLLVVISMLLPGFSPSARATVSQDDTDCSTAIVASLNHKLTESFEDDAKIGFIRLDIPSAGLLDLETSDLDESARTTVAFLGTRCRAVDSQERAFNRHQLIEIAQPGSYYAAVAATSAASAARFTLQIGFAPGLDARIVEVAGPTSSLVDPPAEPSGDEPIELVLDPGGNYIYPPMFMRFSIMTLKKVERNETVPGAKGDEPIELVLDPGGNYVYTPLSLRFSLASPISNEHDGLAVVSSGKASPPSLSYNIRYLPVAVCPAAERDDHGDTLACATELAMGSSLDAEIAGSPEKDHDTFTFTLKRRATVTLVASGEVATEGVLLDAVGSPLAHLADERGDGFRIETALEPGRYYLRVGAQTDEQGSYQLQLVAQTDNP